MRKYLFAIPMIALALAACQDTQDPKANFQVRDAEHGDEFGKITHPYLYFLPPIVSSPTYPEGTTLESFDLGLESQLIVTVTRVGERILVDHDGDPNTPKVPEAPPGASCTSGPSKTLAAPTLDPTTGVYATAWNTRKKGGNDPFDVVKADTVYRICVTTKELTVGDQVIAPILLGWRDVMPDFSGADQPRATDQEPVWQFGAGGNVNVKFTVLDGLYSEALCTGGTGPYDYDCTAQFLSSNETATCDNETCALTTGEMNTTELFLVEKFGQADPACFNNGAGAAQDGFPLDIDLPQYAGCLRVTLFDPEGDFTGFLSRGSLEACYYEETGPTPLFTPEQEEAIQLHVQYPTGEKWALPWTVGGEVQEIDCEEFAPPSGGVVGAVQRMWYRTQELVNPWFAPPKLYAFHTGFGGHTSLRSTEPGLVVDVGSSASLVDGGTTGVTQYTGTAAACDGPCPPKVYSLLWALPSQMARYSFCDDAGNCSADKTTLRVAEGASVTIKVNVTDNGAVDDAGTGAARVAWPNTDAVSPRPVNGATVWFDKGDDADPEPSTTDDSDFASGLAFASFTLTADKSRTIKAYGRGIGTAAGPFDAFNPDGSYSDKPAQLLTPELAFNLLVCPAAPTVDGNVTAVDGYPTLSGDPKVITDNSAWRTIPVNLGGNTTGTGYLYVTNDCDYLYLTFLMPSDPSKDNKLRFVFSETGVEALNDDILSLSVAGFRDRHLSQDCIGSKQADCGPDDDPLNPTGDGAGVASYQTFLENFLGQPSWYVYEMKQKLNSGSNLDFTLVYGSDLAAENTIYFYGAVSLGTGTKGNTEFPDQKGNFKDYGYKYVLQK